MELSLQFLKKQVERLAHRTVEIERTKSGKYICKFMDFNMSPLSLVADTEVEAYQKLYQYLTEKKTEGSDEPEPPAAA
jgi:hypothetical protein